MNAARNQESHMAYTEHHDDVTHEPSQEVETLQRELSETQDELISVLDHCRALHDQVARVKAADIFPSIDRNEELEKLFNLIAGLPN
jgi:hypothetical protein